MNYCPTCGNATYGAEYCFKCGTGKTVAVEQTGKKWKKLKLIASALLIAGLITVTAGAPAIGIMLMLGGLGVAIYTGVGAWWHHA